MTRKSKRRAVQQVSAASASYELLENPLARNHWPRFPGNQRHLAVRPAHRTCGNPDFAVHRYAADLMILDEWSAILTQSGYVRVARHSRCPTNALPLFAMLRGRG